MALRRRRIWKTSIGSACAAGGLRFNISHTRGLVACAIAYRELGVDEESADRSTDIDIADIVFAPEEVSIVKSAHHERQRCLFFRFWTLKEAFIKATGEGPRRPLDSFSFGLDPVRLKFHAERHSGSHPGDPDGWQFAEYRPLPNRHLALAFRHTPSRPVRLDVRAARPEEIIPTYYSVVSRHPPSREEARPDWRAFYLSAVIS